jgi:signal transduction histidine kinase
MLAMLARRALGSRMERVARACHELRGPITAARLGLELGARVGELSPARLRAIDAELGRASLALEDLAGARAALPPAAPVDEVVDVRELLINSVEAWRPAAAAAGKQIRLQCDDGVADVPGDRHRLAQATGNLIANAIEHGGAKVEVSGTFDPAGARIEVIDDGPGLPAPIAELIRRARNGWGAHGRGLAIAAGIAAGHGGRLRAAPGRRGARLVLELPLPDRPAVGLAPGVTPSAAPGVTPGVTPGARRPRWR